MKIGVLDSDQDLGRGVGQDVANIPAELRVCEVDWQKDTLIQYWGSRRLRSYSDQYMGVQMFKFPEDLATYEHLIWETKPEVIVELGTCSGGSAMWFADRMRAMYGRLRMAVCNPLVVAVDVDQWAPRQNCAHDASIVLIEGDAAEKVDEVEKWVSGRRCMVVEDTKHDYETTSKLLQTYHKLVSPGCYYSVEDTHIDDETLRWTSDPRGAGRAVLRFASEHPEFQICLVNFYGLTCNRLGWLRRRMVE